MSALEHTGELSMKIEELAGPDGENSLRAVDRH